MPYIADRRIIESLASIEKIAKSLIGGIQDRGGSAKAKGNFEYWIEEIETLIEVTKKYAKEQDILLGRK